MKWSFLSKAESGGGDWECSMCGGALDEGYLLKPVADEEWNTLTQRFGGEPSDWFLGECCFGGYCYRPDTFYRKFLSLNASTTERAR